MRVSLKIAAALVICLLGPGSEAGASETPAPEGTPSAVTLPPSSEAPEQTPLEPQFEQLKLLVREHGKTTEALDEEIRAIQQYVTGGLLTLPLLLLLAFGLLAAFLRRQNDPKPVAVDVGTRLQDLESRAASTLSLAEELGCQLDGMRQELQQLGGFGERISELESKVSTPSPIPPDLTQDLASLKGSLDERFKAVAAAQNGPTPVVSPVPLEREVLKEAWNKFRENKEIMAVLSNARDGNWKEIREPLLVQLARSVPEDLRPTFDAAVAPARDFDNLMTKISLVQRLLRNEMPPLPSEAQELMRLRELTSLLTMIQSSNLVADRLEFRLERWIVDCFLGFADLFLQRYQQAQMGNGVGHLEPGLEIVRRILKIADLEPVELTLGVTPFDSTRHIGRSTASDPSVASGVILGVVRNGFVRGGQQVIRQPEVIVNRVA